MARTPILRWFQQLAKDHRTAAARGTSPEQVREDRALTAERKRQEGPSRRDVLLGAAAITAGLALPKVARAAGGPRIAIVGGGVSGLNAALTLADAGIASTVYESSGRLGGRMFSNSTYWANGQVSEWCGELIDSGHKTVQALARRFNLQLADLLWSEPNGAEDTYQFFGQYYSKQQADIDFQVVHNALQGDVQAASYPTTYQINTPGGRALDAMSVYDWIESRVPGGHRSPMGMLLDVAYTIEYGGDSTDQSALNLVYLLGYKANPGNFAIFGASDERFHIVGGNQQLPLAIARALGNGAVQTGMRLSALRLNPSGSYTLTFNDRQDVTADYVILTLPFAVLRTLSYQGAGFDALKDRAIQQLGSGRNGKLQLQFNSRFWNGLGPWPGISNGASYSDTGYQSTWDVTRGQAGASGILVDYTGGSVSAGMSTRVPWANAANSQVQSDAQRFLAQAAPVFPSIGGQWNGKATSSLPFLDPNFNCSYSYWRVGQCIAFSGYEKARQGNVFFGGEHCSQDFQGFMEGGAQEGARAAREVLAAIGSK